MRPRALSGGHAAPFHSSMEEEGEEGELARSPFSPIFPWIQPSWRLGAPELLVECLPRELLREERDTAASQSGNGTFIFREAKRRAIVQHMKLTFLFPSFPSQLLELAYSLLTYSWKVPISHIPSVEKGVEGVFLLLLCCQHAQQWTSKPGGLLEKGV